MQTTRKALRRRLAAWSAALAAAVPAAMAAAPSPATAGATAISSVPASGVTAAPMAYACADRRGGVLHFAWRPARCTPREQVVPITPGPVVVCLEGSGPAVLAGPAGRCPVPGRPGRHGRPPAAQRRTLPPATAPVYFCAADGSGVLTGASGPARCSASQFAVVVPVPAPPAPPVATAAAPQLGAVEVRPVAYELGTPPVAVTSSLTVTAPATTELTGATVSIGSGFVAGQDALEFTNGGGIEGDFDPATGVLSLTGDATAASYQAALRSVTYSDPLATTTPGTRVVDFTVRGGAGSGATSNVVERPVDVAAPPAIPDPLPVLPAGSGPGSPGAAAAPAPVLAGLETTPLAYTTGSPAVPVTATLTVTSPATATLAGATVAVVGGYAAGEDVLQVAGQNGIAGHFDATTGVLSLSGTASVADYQAALRSVTYEDLSGAPTVGTRTVSIVVDDGRASNPLSNAVTRQVAVSAPVAPCLTGTLLRRAPRLLGIAIAHC